MPAVTSAAASEPPRLLDFRVDEPSADALLEAFLSWAAARNLEQMRLVNGLCAILAYARGASQ